MGVFKRGARFPIPEAQQAQTNLSGLMCESYKELLAG